MAKRDRAKKAAAPAVRPVPLPASPWRGAWLVLAAACLLLVAVLGLRFLRDSDLGFHLRTGQWIVEHRAVPTQDEYTYTAAGRPFVDGHWLYQIVLFGLQSALGYPALVIANVLLLVGVFLLTFARLRLARAPVWAAALLVLLATLSCETRFHVRPEIVTWLLLSLTLLVLDLRLRGGRNLLFLLPVIQLVWVNVEGLFALGWVAMAAYVLSDTVHARRLDRDLLKYCLLALAASFLNPYFVRGVFLPMTLATRLEGSNLFKQVVQELRSPWTLGPGGLSGFVAGGPLLVYKGLSVLTLIAVLATIRSRRLHEVLLVVAFFYLSATAERNTPLFVLVAVPVLGACVADMRWGWARGLERRLLEKPALAAALTVVVVLIGLRVVTNAYYLSDRREDRFGAGLDTERLPVEAARFLVEHRLDGRILNHMNAGGWLVWRGPQKVFVTGNLEVIGEDLMRESLRSFAAGGLARQADRFRADLILFDPKAAPSWVMQLKTMRDWRPVYVAGYAAIFARAGYAPEVPAVDLRGLLAERGIPLAPARPLPILEAARAGRLSAWIEGFYRPQSYPEGLMNVGLTAYLLERRDVAESVFVDLVRQTRGRYFELFHNLGLVYLDEERLDLASYCMRRALEGNPRDAEARQVLLQLAAG